MNTDTNETPVVETPQTDAGQNQSEGKKERTWTEEIEVTGAELVERIKKLIADGNVRRLIIRNEKGESLLEVPLTAGVVVGGVFAIAFPVLAAIGALAALLVNVKLEVVRVVDDGNTQK